jgi:alanyl-tRNA synthetase
MHEDEFGVPFFRENGFVRKRCQICGSHFWTQDHGSVNCGDAPCQDYTFIGKSPVNKSYSVAEIRRKFLKFFERNGHAIIEPYPVIARWRDDVFLVGASIFDFQPYVTDGVLPPPANPLVVSQPCLRFTDIDNVGPTAGRHLSIFEMGGAHAFNYPDKSVYWKDQTIRYHHELLTKDLGVKSELVNYKEHFWSGGGNAGPDVEACVNGLEISTLVFMVYKTVGDQLIEMPIKTVDTGYGMERWAWLSQGSPSGFHAIYGTALDKIMSYAGISIDRKLIAESTRFSGKMSVETLDDKLAARRKVAELLGMDWKELDKLLTPIESAYAVADHTKSLAFMLAEGVVPSNVHEGYLTRLLIRRTYRMLRLLGIEDRLPDIFDLQISLWGEDFPNLKHMRSEILEALEVEGKKYRRTLERGSEMVKRMAIDLKSEGKKEIPQDTLVQLYDSHGLVPDIVKDIGEREGMEVKIPSDFFGMVAKRHLSATPPQESSLIKELKEKVSGLPATRMLYYEDTYMKEFEAKVTASFDGKYVALDQTCFYSEGGGQMADHGTLRFESGSVNVVDVQKVGNVIVHIAEGELPNVGEAVKGEIDWDRRISLMRHHTATHILIGAARRVLGEHAWQSGAQKDVDRSRLDISHYRHLSEDEIDEIEKLTFEVVAKNMPVETMWMPRQEAERAYGFRLYQGGAVPGKEIRVVKVGDWDVEACGGTHCKHTGEVGLIKILRAERIQDGVERLIFVAGVPALKAIQDQEALLTRTAQILKTTPDKMEKVASDLVSERQILSKQLEEFRAEATTQEARILLMGSRKVGRLKLVASKRTSGTEEELIMLSSKVVEAEPSTVCVLVLVKETVRIFVAAGKQALKAGVDAGDLAKKLAEIVGGGGGGKPYFGQGGGTDIKKADEVLTAIKRLLAKKQRSR